MAQKHWRLNTPHSLHPQPAQNRLIRSQVDLVYHADLMEKKMLCVSFLQAHVVRLFVVRQVSCAPHGSFSKVLNLLFQLGLGLSLCRCHFSLARLST